MSGTRWSVNGIGNFWGDGFELDLDRDGINDLPHRELDLFSVLRRDFPAIAFLSDSPALKLLRFAHGRAALPGVNTIEDSASLTPAILETARSAHGKSNSLQAMIAAEHLVKNYGRKPVLRDMSISANAGEITLWWVQTAPERRRR